jgi:hypothetical protein
MIQNLRLGTVMPDKLPYPCKLIEASYCTAANTAGRGKIRSFTAPGEDKRSHELSRIGCRILRYGYGTKTRIRDTSSIYKFQ